MKELTTTVMQWTLNKQDGHLTIGLDLGDRLSFYCVLGEAGEVLLEQKVSTTPKAIREVFGAISRSRIFTIHRVDPDRSYSSAYAPNGKLFTAEYTGSIVGNHLTGKVFACTWTGDSPQIPCSSSASCPLTSDQMLELGKNAARAGLMSAARQSFRMSASMGNPTARALVDSMLPSAVP
jgi:hypothetical protein